MKRVAGVLCLGLLLSMGGAVSAYADGCYLCGSGSSPNCKNYCRYFGQDTFDARKKCEKAGCKVTGTGMCPSAVNFVVCNPARASLSEEQWCLASSPMVTSEGPQLFLK